MGSVIIGSGRALPARIVTNDELSEIVDTTDEWIVPRTGIHIRHIMISIPSRTLHSSFMTARMRIKMQGLR